MSEDIKPALSPTELAAMSTLDLVQRMADCREMAKANNGVTVEKRTAWYHWSAEYNAAYDEVARRKDGAR